MDNPTASKTFPALAPGVYWIIVEAYPNLPGTTTVTLSTGSVVTPEICANGRDDDGNGLVDCQDAACSNHTSCIGSLCVPDLNVGTLVVDGPARLGDGRYPHGDRRLSVDLRGGRRRRRHRDRVHAGRDRGAGGRVPADRAEHLLDLPMPPPGLACDAGSGAVLVSGRRPERASRSSACPRDGTCSSSKAQSTSLAGVINLRMSAFGLRPRRDLRQQDRRRQRRA
jgi:hypothetical protein